MSTIRLRSPNPGEAEHLTQMILRSKASWGYDAAFMAKCEDILRVSEDDLATQTITVAVDQHDSPIGVARLEVIGTVAHLSRMFIDPKAMGQGVGRALFAKLRSNAMASGATEMRLDSDPGAEGFYQRLGFVRIGTIPSDGFPGRELPLMSLML